MPLEDLEKKLYSEEEEKKSEWKTKVVPRAYEPELKRQEWVEERKRPVFLESEKKKKIFGVILGILFLTSIISGLIFYYSRKIFKPEEVSLLIKGPEKIISGEKIRFTVIYKNKNKISLKNPEIILKWPEGSELEEKDGAIDGYFVKKTLNEIPPTFEGSVYFEGKIFGAKNENFSVEAGLKYQPENISSVFENSAKFSSEIASTPISLNLKIPSIAASGKDFEFSVNYLNLSNTTFSKIRIQLDYPDSFQFYSAEPMPDISNNIWEFKKLLARESGTIKIRGKLKGAQNEAKSFSADLGTITKNNVFVSYAKEISSTIISSSALLVFQTINGSAEAIVSAGDTLEYKISYKNNSDVPISNVVIKTMLEGKVLDFGSLNISWGSFDPKTNTITWTAAGVPDLAILDPQKEGEIFFSIKVKSPLPVSFYTDKNFLIKSKTAIDSSYVPEMLSGIPIGSETALETKVNTIYSFSSEGYFQNDLILNTGSIPPKVGKKTTYTIIWQMTNVSNDLDNISIETSLPPFIEWLGNIFPAGANFKFDKTSNKINLQLEKLKAGSGIYSSAQIFAFQVALVPASYQAGEVLNLTNETKFSATDSFTGKVFEETKKTIDTNILNDSSFGGKGKVEEQ